MRVGRGLIRKWLKSALMRFKRAMREGVWRILALILGLTAGQAMATPPRCQLEQEASAWALLEVWAQALAGRNGVLTAHSTSRIAVVVDHRGTVLEALMLVALEKTDRRGQHSRRPQWVRCAISDDSAPSAY